MTEQDYYKAAFEEGYTFQEGELVREEVSKCGHFVTVFRLPPFYPGREIGPSL